MRVEANPPKGRSVRERVKNLSLEAETEGESAFLSLVFKWCSRLPLTDQEATFLEVIAHRVRRKNQRERDAEKPR